ncbi:MAG: hypothetical protein QW514_04760 [Thermoprotei archaeon]
MAYFIDGVGDLLKQMFGGMSLKDLTKKALDRKLPVEVRLRVVDLIFNYGEEGVHHLEKVARKADVEVAKYASRKLLELKSPSRNKG